MWSRFEVGSNLVMNTPGIIQVDGEDLVALESDEAGRLLLTVDVFTRDGDAVTHVAKLRRNAWAFGDPELYEFTTAPSNLSLVEKATGVSIVQASANGAEAKLEIAMLYTRSGIPIVIDEDAITVGAIRLKHNVFDGLGSVIDIRGGALGIGASRKD